MLSVLALLSLMSPQAEAAAFMWGVGPTVSTVIYPVSYPGKLPNAVPDAFDLGGARADVGVSGHGLFYLNNQSRLGARGRFDLGSGWRGSGLTLEYERMLTSESGFHLFFGGGMGLGRATFVDEADNQLLVSEVLGRAQFGATYRDRVRAYEVALYTQLPVPLEHRVVPADGAEEVIKGRGARYGQVGMEASVYFGDFTPPRKRPKKGGGKPGRPR